MAHPNPRQELEMAKLTTKARKALPAKDFAGPKRSYPIQDKSHARNALARASQFASPAVKADIKAHIASKYPSMKIAGKSKSSKHNKDMPKY